METKKVSKFSTYAGGSIVNSLKGAFAAAAFCMVPYASEGMVYSVVPAATGGLSVGGMFISTDAMIALTGTVGYTITFSNMAVKASDSLEGVVGTNVMENMVGEEGYQKIAEASQSGSEIIFMMGLMNPDLYVKDQRVTNIRQVAAYDNSGGGSGGGADVPDGIKRIDEIEIEFNYNSKYDETEFARQLEDQQKGMNDLTVQEYLDNRQKYIEQGRAIESDAVQQAAREKAFVDKVDELQDAGLSLKEAEEQAQKWLGTQAALHNPDQVAGGYASNVGGVGDRGVNSSIGSQWRYRIDDVDAQIQKVAESMSEAEKNSTYLNVNLTYKGE